MPKSRIGWLHHVNKNLQRQIRGKSILILCDRHYFASYPRPVCDRIIGRKLYLIQETKLVEDRANGSENPRNFVSLDIGTTSIKVVVAEHMNGQVNIIGVRK